jgi:hypothetical protein
MANQGLYGLPQGNESRGAGRHQHLTIGAERLDETQLVEGEVETRWRGFWQTGANESLREDVDRTRQAWLNGFLPGGELPNGREITEDIYRNLVNGRITSILTRATFGPPGKGSRRRVVR